MSLSTRHSALATIFSIQQPRLLRSNRIHLGIPIRDTQTYRDVDTQMDPAPDSSYFVASKSEPEVPPPWKTRNTSDISHRPHQTVTKKKKNMSSPSKDKKTNQKKKGALSPLKRKTYQKTNEKTKKEPMKPPKNPNLLNLNPPKISQTNFQSEISISPNPQNNITQLSPQRLPKTTKPQNNQLSIYL